MSYTKEQRKALVAKGQAIPNLETGGDYPIANLEDIKSAIALAGESKTISYSRARRHIIKVAKKLRLTKALPEEWNVSSEDNMNDINLFLQLETDGIPGIEFEGTDSKTGVMRARMPFYVARVFAEIPGFDKRFYMSEKILPEMVAEGMKVINAKKQPLNVYARHRHAHSGNDLPVGVVSNLEYEGRFGYSTLDVIPEGPVPQQLQGLLKRGMVNAVSLRSKRGDFELSEKSIDGEDVYVPTRMLIAGIDFAPDSPAMPTYGIELIAAESVQIDDPVTHNRKEVYSIVGPEELDLETVRKRSDIVAEIERPLKQQITDLTSERNDLKDKFDKSENWKKRAMDAEAKIAEHDREAFLREVASSFEKPDETYTVLAEACKDARTKDEVSAIVMPVILRGMKTRTVSTETKATKSAGEMLFERLFPGQAAGAGNVRTEGEGEEKDDAILAESDADLPLPF